MPEIVTAHCSAFCYRTFGSGPAIVLLHGFPADGSLWQELVYRLSERYKVLVPDLPGSGRSSLEGDTSLEDMALCVREMLRAEQIDRVMMAGHSMGGYVALAYAKAFPETVVGLSLIHSTPAADDEERKTIRRKAIEIIKNGGKDMFIRQMIANLFASGFKQLSPGAVERITGSCLAMKEQSLINFYNAMILRPDRVEWLKTAGFPVQWVMGEEDNVLPYIKNITNCYLSDINFVSVLNNVGHMSMIECPETLTDLLSDFAGYAYRSRTLV